MRNECQPSILYKYNLFLFQLNSKVVEPIKEVDALLGTEKDPQTRLTAPVLSLDPKPSLPQAPFPSQYITSKQYGHHGKMLLLSSTNHHTTHFHTVPTNFMSKPR